jgi:hypothetical protein
MNPWQQEIENGNSDLVQRIWMTTQSVEILGMIVLMIAHRSLPRLLFDSDTSHRTYQVQTEEMMVLPIFVFVCSLGPLEVSVSASRVPRLPEST